MLFIETISELRSEISIQRHNGKRIVFVPTMGNLHEGHLRLIDTAREHGDFVVCSIFVNPTQFGEGEDFEKYPRTLENDQNLLKERGCHLLFHPKVHEVYPNNPAEHQLTTVKVPEITEELCGASRPGHFDGVATVVSKLFNITQPDVAVFGEKDFQQLALIKKLTIELNFPIEIIGVKTARESNGLAMSSRNGYLSEEEKQQASFLYALLEHTKQEILSGKNNFQALEASGIQKLIEKGFKPDYFSIRNSVTLKKANPEDKNNSLVILLAAYIGNTRLIDNLYFETRCE